MGTLKRYQSSIHISEADIDDLGHVNNIVYLKWVQEMAFKHWQACSSKDEQIAFKWVATRHEIDYLKPTFARDTLQLETWVEEMTGVKSIRKVEIRKDGILVAQALTVWVMIDAQTAKPKRIPLDMIKRFIKE
jgi:acyl-CoA thioester hydrolase